MAALLARAVREIFRRELIPVRLRWWFAGEANIEWYRLVRDELAPQVGGRAAAANLLSEICAPMLARRYDSFRTVAPSLPERAADPRAVGLALGGLYRVASHPDSEWIFDAVGGAPRTFWEHARVERWLAETSFEARWHELTCHLGELLIALTERLTPHLPRANAFLGELCFRAGARFGRKMKRAFELDDTPTSALELLRMSEYVFRVNEQHTLSADDATRTGALEGDACPWFDAPGWAHAHCGIFGQFQTGITSVFGLRYHLATTIPRHGGGTCRIEVRPIQLRKHRDEAAGSRAAHGADG